ncbi:MAG: hypothetical protein JXR07_07655 [Reichenbachiella sp.]
MDDNIKLRGFSITKESMNERFGVVFDDGEWYHFKKEVERTWNEMEFGLEKTIVDHIKNSLFKLDFKPTLKNDRLVFERK